MERYFITGCNGQLGRAFNMLLADEKDIVIKNTDVDTLDITDEIQVMEKVVAFQPTVILNCAAHTAVDACEQDRDNAYRINALGAENLAKAAEKSGAVMVQVSTDYVFPGDADTPYVETSPTGPQSVYGETKLAGERAVQEICSRYYIVRTAWLYGDGKNFVRTMLNLSQTHDTLTVVCDQLGSPTSAMELARMILHILPSGEYGIYHGTCEGEVTWDDFARTIFKKKGISTDVKSVTSEEYNAAAKRPAYSVLENAKLNSMGSYRMKHWEDALDEYLGV